MRPATELALVFAFVGGTALAQAPPRSAAPPPGYRTVTGQTKALAGPVDRSVPTAGGGRVLYFQKPADSAAVSPDPGDMSPPAVPVAVAEPPPPPAPPIQPVAAQLVSPPLEPEPVFTASGGTVVPPPDVELPTPVVPPAAAAPPVAAYTVVVQALPDPPPKPTKVQKKQDFPPKEPLPAGVTSVPSRDKIFIMYDDAALERFIMERVRSDLTGPGKDIKIDAESLRFPSLMTINEGLAPPGTVYKAKTATYDPRMANYEAGYVIHRRLHFEEKNAERAGWDFGIIQPVVSTLYFYKDVLLFPNSLASGTEVGFWDASPGKCLPGSATPYYLYPPGLTISGVLFEAGLITGGAYILAPIGAAPFVP